MDRGRVESPCAVGRNVIYGDTKDPAFWSCTPLDNVRLIMFSILSCLNVLEAQKQLNKRDFKGRTAGVAKYKNEEALLLESSVDEVFNFYAEVGNGFANLDIHLLKRKATA
ncbi:MAG: glutathione-regulated potassium-efflux system ancillary protein KefC [Candidatus Endobugula sp.]|jgi:glutathione-regulated potassium-efflux system ancillary protein KefC